jgi:hypothetical protein
MNPAKQFWTLFKFQATVNPFIWFMPVAFGAPLMINLTFSGSYHPNLASLLSVQNLFFVGILGAIALVPERFQFGANTAAWSSGTEFLLTRAVDRPVLFRSKAAFMYLLVLLLPLVGLIHAFSHPDLVIHEYSSQSQQLCLSQLPGSALQADPERGHSPLILIPGGNVIMEAWHVWQFIGCTLVTQMLILTLHPFRFRILIFYALFLSLVFVPLFFQVSDFRDLRPSAMEYLFFLFASHQALFWIVTALTVVLGELWCERRFASLEQ